VKLKATDPFSERERIYWSDIVVCSKKRPFLCRKKKGRWR